MTIVPFDSIQLVSAAPRSAVPPSKIYSQIEPNCFGELQRLPSFDRSLKHSQQLYSFDELNLFYFMYIDDLRRAAAANIGKIIILQLLFLQYDVELENINKP